MISDLEDYIEQHISPESEILKDIDRHTNLYRINGRMCSGHIQGRLLKMLTAMIRPKLVLELGTFSGYSALCIAEALDDDSRIFTIEVDDEFAEEIMVNLKRSPHGNKISLIIGDALECLTRFEDNTFDMVVIDADKREYPQYLKRTLPLLNPGGFILADNTLWDGHVTEKGKHSSQTNGILEFNDLVMKDPDLEVAMIPFRDGLSIIRKLK